MKTVIELFRELREDNDYSQSEIASVLGISQQHYSKYETGEYELPLRHFIKLAKYYDVSADYLIGRSVFDENNRWIWCMLLVNVLVLNCYRIYFH